MTYLYEYNTPIFITFDQFCDSKHDHPVDDPRDRLEMYTRYNIII